MDAPGAMLDVLGKPRLHSPRLRCNSPKSPCWQPDRRSQPGERKVRTFGIFLSRQVTSGRLVSFMFVYLGPSLSTTEL